MSAISVDVPKNIYKKVEIGRIYENLGASGRVTSYGVDISLSELGLRKICKSRDISDLSIKVENALRLWGEQYARHEEKIYKNKRNEDVDDWNEAIRDKIEKLEGILEHTVHVDDRVAWEKLQNVSPFSISPDDLFRDKDAPPYLNFDKKGKPKKVEETPYPSEPTIDGIRKEFGLFMRLFFGKKIIERYQDRHTKWTNECKIIDNDNISRRKEFHDSLGLYEELEKSYKKQKEEYNKNIEELMKRYHNKDSSAIEEHADIVLNNSIYPDEFPRNWEMEYRPDPKILIINYELPTPEVMPSVESYSYIKSRDEIKEKKFSASKINNLYDSVIYQICIRTIHEMFESDVVDAFEMVTFNGYIDIVSPATGNREVKIIISISASKSEFNEINISSVDPKATFKHLKGVSAARLSDLAAVPPVMIMDKTDKRFIEGVDQMAAISSTTNIASMGWQEFEYLIRELFHKEFASTGGEVKVTQASADGGVDAVAFDPDPIRGGKIVIQAKRYTNTVGVSAVRDLYGTILNEGASSGILVTTSDYGKDAYEFVKNKPIKLLNGSNLLALLEKHGHNARIDLAEAKKLLS